MSHKAKDGGVVYNIVKGLTKQNGQALSIQYGKTKVNGVVKTIVLAEETPAGKLLEMGVSAQYAIDPDYNYMAVNYIDGSQQKITDTGTYNLTDVASLYFYCYGGSASIQIGLDAPVTANNGGVETSWVPTTERIGVRFNGATGRTAEKEIVVSIY